MKNLRIFEVVEFDDLQTAKERPERLRFLNFLYTLAVRGLPYEQYNLIEDPIAFMSDEKVAAVLEDKGDSGFPLLFIDDELKWQGSYPSVEELAEAIGQKELADKLESLPERFFETACGSGGCAGCSGCGG